MVRRTRRSKRGMADATAGALLTVVGLALILALGGAVWWVRSTRVALDPQTNCPADGPRAVHVVIFDRSDPVSPQQRQRIRQVMDKLKSEAPFGYRFDIYTFEGDAKNVLEPIRVVCSPGPPWKANWLIENPERVLRNYEERFASVLDQAIDPLLKSSVQPSSPIIESLRSAAISSFGPLKESFDPLRKPSEAAPRQSRKVPLRVTLFSDMIQNTAFYSQIRLDWDFDKLSKHPEWPSLRPDFNGADVEIFYLLRPQKGPGGRPVQSRGHQAFWEALVAASNGRPMGFEAF
jgi:hypothetical protein